MKAIESELKLIFLFSFSTVRDREKSKRLKSFHDFPQLE